MADRVGGEVAVDQDVVTVETDKSVMDVPSPWAGVLAARHGEIGDVVAVGRPLFEIEAAG